MHPLFLSCHSERSEESRVHKVGIAEIHRYALDDKMIGGFYFDTASFLCLNGSLHFPKEIDSSSNHQQA
jgi:hypothetical protein